MKWSPQQETALRKVNDWFCYSNEQVFRLFGYAGTGKTTLAKTLAEGIPGTVLFAAYTGKAAYVLQKKGCPASTIHSLIYHSRDKGKAKLLEIEKTLFGLVAELKSQGLDDTAIKAHRRHQDIQKLLKEENEALSQPFFMKNTESEVRGASLVIIDECSMVDERMGKDLLSFGTKVLVLGDPAQLPPVGGAGFFTEKVKPDVMLDEIHRQAAESGIIRLATDLRNMKKPKKNYGDGVNVYDLENVNADLVVQPDQIIVGRNRTRTAYNNRLRQILGHSQNDNRLPVVGDRVVCLKNNHDAGLLNGALFTVAQVGPVYDLKIALEVVAEDSAFSQTVSSHIHHFQGRGDQLSFWEKKSAEEFDYGYAMTCHKSQGSQWGHVMVFDESQAFRTEWHRWAYTAATRAAETLSWVNME